MSPWLIQTFLRSLPRMLPRRRVPSKHCASRRPLLMGGLYVSMVCDAVFCLREYHRQRTRRSDGEKRKKEKIPLWNRSRQLVGVGRVIGMHSPKHLHDLCILLAILLEGELTLLVVVLVLSTSSVLSSLSLVLGHSCGVFGLSNASCCVCW